MDTSSNPIFYTLILAAYVQERVARRSCTVSNSTAIMGCPYASKEQAKASDVSMCPFASNMQLSAKPSDPPTCPLGFGSASGPKLTMLHCPVCKSLLFDAHCVISCKHTFCRSCISQTRDCPSCGRDVDGLEPNTELAGLVETFLDTHSQSPDLVSAQADLGPLPNNSAASFFMAQGLKSMRGGNLHAAISRLGRAREASRAAKEAQQTPDSLSAPPAAEAAQPPSGTDSDEHRLHDRPRDAASADSLSSMAADGSTHVNPSEAHHQQQPALHTDAAAHAVQLATICGSLGDCHQRLGEQEHAVQLYKESIAIVQPYAEGNAEAAHAMSVSLSKLGDMQYMADRLPAAKAAYREALQLRQLCCGPLTSGQAGPVQQLDLAASCIKYADVCKAMGEAHETDQLMHRAHGICCEVAALGSDAPLPPHSQHKLDMMMAVLQARSQHVEVQADAGGVTAAAAHPEPGSLAVTAAEESR